jgi:(1->4)-alpha-D-glucan 1-alpha-D-glucosylmutase
VTRWRTRHRSARTTLRGRSAPDAHVEYLFYQSLIALWPSEASEGLDSRMRDELHERLDAYMLKAIREAKARTSWTDPDEAYEKAVSLFVAALLEGELAESFLGEVGALVARLEPAATWIAISRTLIHALGPGTPDVYQGDELWLRALVDPDNRRPVDFALREELLRAMEHEIQAPPNGRAGETEGAGARERMVAELVRTRKDGRLKLYTLWQALRLRRERAELFTEGEYLRLAVSGARAAHVIAFARLSPSASVLVVVPRLTVALAEVPVGAAWGNTSVELPATLRTESESWLCALTGALVMPIRRGASATIQLSTAFRTLPALMLLPSSGATSHIVSRPSGS